MAWLAHPPFTSRLDNDELVQALRQQVEAKDNQEETEAAYRWAIEKAPQDRWLHFNSASRLKRAIRPRPSPNSAARSSSCPATPVSLT
jgi:hypothetical protein